jgi:pimeloyl-ACP methyl ester carboxylesterase
MSHLEQDWINPGWGPYIRHLAGYYSIVRYDLRGNGLSAWDDVDICFERMVEDLACVIDFSGHEKIAIFGGSQGAAVAIAYTIKCPSRVSHLVLYGGYARGRRKRGDPAATAESEALVTLIREGWGRDNPAIRQQITTMFMPDATQDEMAWFNGFQKLCAPAENVAKFRQTFDEIDIAASLDYVTVPTLVIHSEGDAVAPISEGKLLASRIPGARFVVLQGRSHMILENDPEFPKFLNNIVKFIGDRQHSRT